MEEEDLVIHSIFKKTVSRFGDKIALQIKKDGYWQKFTYAEIEKSALEVSVFLAGQGLKKSEYAAIILENRPEWPIIYLGIVCAGLICVPLDPQLSELEIKNLIADSNSKVIFTSHNIFSEKNIHKLKQSLSKIVILDSDIDQENLLGFSAIRRISEKNILLPKVYPQDIASLIYTSGTTANPKGVLLSHYNLCSNLRSIQKLGVVFSSDNILSILPLYHSYAFMVTLMVPLLSGMRVTYFAGFASEDLAGIIKEAKVTILVGVPQLFAMMHKAIFDKLKKIPLFLRPFLLPFFRAKVQGYFGRDLRLLVSGGARLEPKIGRDFSRLGLRLIEGYGLTETSPVVTLNPAEKIKFGSAGRPVPGVEIKIFNPDKSGIGEVLIKGPNVMQGYFKRPDLSEEAIKEGWFYSGDLGYIDKEGYLYLVGRKKDVIVLGSGKNIYPEELEDYYSHTPYIKEVCVLSKSEIKFGREQDFLYAVIVPNLEYFRLKNEKDIRGKLRWELENLAKKLPGYKHIMGFAITKEELPRTRLKKIKRYALAQKYLKERMAPAGEIKKIALCEEDLQILNSDVAKKVMHYLSGELKRTVYLDSHLEIDLGIDSLSRVELGLGLQALFSIEISDELIDTVSTVKELIVNIQDIISKPAAQIYIREKQKTWGQILKELPSEKLLKRIRITLRLLDKIIAFILKNIFLFIFKVFWSLKTEGRNFIPSRGPYILCPNHASYLDGFFVFSALPFHSAVDTFFLGHTAIFEHPLVSWAVKLARLIPIDPSAYLTEAMQAASYVLEHKKVICIFPEGGRSIDEQIGEFKKGIGILAKELNVQVIPVYIQGSHYSWPRTSKFPRPFIRVKVIFGRPIYWRNLGNDYETIADALRKEVLKLACLNKETKV